MKFQKFHLLIYWYKDLNKLIGFILFHFSFILCEIKLCSFSKCMKEYIDDYAWDYNWKKFQIMFYWDNTLINFQSVFDR